VLELLSEKRIATPVERVGWPDQFIEHASTVDYLRQKYGLTAATWWTR
jgi:1-deoxy-D-xylulose-5-phosphate synthase